MYELSIYKTDHVLIIAPHPDDESIGTGGLIARYSSQCTVVVATDGGKSNPNIKASDMAKARREEMDSAMKLGGVRDVIMLGYPDGELDQYKECFGTIDFSNYNKVFLPHRDELHPDHVSTFQYAIFEMIRQNVTSALIYQYTTRGPLDNANSYLDISNIISKKVELINCHKSQIKLFDHASFAESINHYHACLSGLSKGHFEIYESITIDEAQKMKDSQKSEIFSYRRQNNYLRKWIDSQNAEGGISGFLSKEGVESVAIYGFGYWGELLYQELSRSDCPVSYIADRNANRKKNSTIEIYNPDEKYDLADSIIVTVINGYNPIVKKLYEQGYRKVFVLWDILEELCTGQDA